MDTARRRLASHLASALECRLVPVSLDALAGF
jgi:hypothetical protein